MAGDREGKVKYRVKFEIVCNDEEGLRSFASATERFANQSFGVGALFSGWVKASDPVITPVVEHRITIRSKKSKAYGNYDAYTDYSPECSCGRYVGAWKQYRGEAVQNGRIHVEKME